MPQLRLERGAPVGTQPPYEKLKPGPGMPSVAVAHNQRSRIKAAMVEFLAKQAYGDITMRDLTGRAGVSTRTFYRCFTSKEECFLATQESTGRRLLQEMAASQIHAGSAETRMRRIIETFLGTMDRDEGIARLMLIEAQTAGPRAQAASRRIQRAMRLSVGHCFIDSNLERVGRHRIAEGVVAGLIGVAQSRFLRKGDPSLLGLTEGLSSWALAYQDPALAKLEGLHRRATQTERGVGPTVEGPPNSDVDLLWSALARLVATRDPEAQSVRNLLKAAGLTRRAFDDNFTSLDQCFAEAGEARFNGALATAVDTAKRRTTPAGGVIGAMDSLCAEVGSDSALANLCFGPLASDTTTKMQGQERMKAHVAELIDCAFGSTPYGGVASLAKEASLAACWGVLQNEVISRDGAPLSSTLSPRLAYLILTPAVGTAEAVDAIRSEYGFQENNQGGVSQYHE